MLEAALLVLVGAFIGWAFPQPAWAKRIQDFVVGLFS